MFLLFQGLLHGPSTKRFIVERKLVLLFNDVFIFFEERVISLQKKIPCFLHKFTFQKAQCDPSLSYVIESLAHPTDQACTNISIMTYFWSKSEFNACRRYCLFFVVFWHWIRGRGLWIWNVDLVLSSSRSVVLPPLLAISFPLSFSCFCALFPIQLVSLSDSSFLIDFSFFVQKDTKKDTNKTLRWNERMGDFCFDFQEVVNNVSSFSNL